MSTLQFLLLFFSVLAGGLLALRIKNHSRDTLRLVLSFSGAYLLGVTSIHLLPEAFNHGHSRAGFWILGGFLLQLLLESLSRGVEHGHIHPEHSVSKTFVIPLMIGLFIHAFIEGIPLGPEDLFHEHEHHGHAHNSLFYGIILHKLPAAFALGALLQLSHFQRVTTILCLVIFGLASPLGALLGGMLELDHSQFQDLLGLVIGTFLHISTTILFEAEDKANHHVSGKKLTAILAGLGLALLTVL